MSDPARRENIASISMEASTEITLSYSTADRNDQICRQFQQELFSGSQPSIEQYLSQADASSREQLLRKLVAADHALRRRNGESDFGIYLQRFPESRHVLEALEVELQRSLYGIQNIPGQDQADQRSFSENLTRKFGHFILLEVVGSGGYGTVWRAMDLALNREVALKIPRADRVDYDHLLVLRREAKAAAKLMHPNIVAVHEVGEEGGLSFIVTDYIRGTNLKIWRKEHELKPREAAKLIAKIAMAIEHAHAKGVVHRDLKLSNVLIDEAGEPHVSDFGLAKQESHEETWEAAGQIVGTPAYMAPEQVRADHKAIDRRTDIYAIGVMLYELLTGVTPFQGTVSEVAKQILETPPVPPRSIKKEIPRDLNLICLKCLAKTNEQRYETAQALADDLQLYLKHRSLRGIPSTLPNQLGKWCYRNRRLILFTSIVVLAAASISASVIELRNRGALAAGLMPVAFTTDPAGCELTLVKIDPDTGEPDLKQFLSPRGRTPLRTSLASGDYLVVATLDSRRFHEVFRHVPKVNEHIPFLYPQLSHRRRSDGVIELPQIRIPVMDVTQKMALCKGTERFEEISAATAASHRAGQIRPFYVDLHEMSVAEMKEYGLWTELFEQKISGPLTNANYYDAVMILEKIGKRPPSAAELLFLATTTNPVSNSTSTEGSTKCSQIEGLHSGLWEWTSTMPGGPFSGSVGIPSSVGTGAPARMVGCGDRNALPLHGDRGIREEGFLRTQDIFVSCQESINKVGIRGVRSASPRRTPEDFRIFPEARESHRAQ